MATDKERIASLETSSKGFTWVLGICVTVFVGVGIWFGTELFSQTGRLSAIETNITVINKSLDELRLKETSLDPTIPASSAEAKNILVQAQQKQIKFSPQVVQSTGSRFVEVGQTNANAWAVASTYLEYRSFLNADYQPTLKDFTPISNDKYHFALGTRTENGAEGKPAGIARVYGVGKSNLATNDARLESIEAGIQTKGTGVQWILVDLLSSTETLVLDGEYMRNVIIRNGTVEYFGGPLILVNVYFVNCKFNFAPKPRSADLSKAMLASAAVNFNDENKSTSFRNPAEWYSSGMDKKKILAAAKTELLKHSLGTFVDDPPPIAEGGKCVVVSGCPACSKAFGTVNQLMHHLADDVLPVILRTAFKIADSA